jgi:hypothetical protein
VGVLRAEGFQATKGFVDKWSLLSQCGTERAGDELLHAICCAQGNALILPREQRQTAD